MWLLLFSAVLFVRMLVNRPDSPVDKHGDEDRREITS
jgi:hypothetical protein